MKFNVDDVPEIPELHASRQNLETVLKPQYWQQLCPTLHVADAKFFRSLVPFQLAKGRLNDLKHQINYAGVAQVCSIEHSQFSQVAPRLPCELCDHNNAAMWQR
jgi:hypothetical protein